MNALIFWESMTFSFPFHPIVGKITRKNPLSNYFFLSEPLSVSLFKKMRKGSIELPICKVTFYNVYIINTIHDCLSSLFIAILLGEKDFFGGRNGWALGRDCPQSSKKLPSASLRNLSDPRAESEAVCFAPPSTLPGFIFLGPLGERSKASWTTAEDII
jgi:hypothetical protein